MFTSNQNTSIASLFPIELHTAAALTKTSQAKSTLDVRTRQSTGTGNVGSLPLKRRATSSLSLSQRMRNATGVYHPPLSNPLPNPGYSSVAPIRYTLDTHCNNIVITPSTSQVCCAPNVKCPVLYSYYVKLLYSVTKYSH